MGTTAGYDVLVMKRTKPRKASVPFAAAVAAVAAICLCTSTAEVDAASAPGAHATIVPERSTNLQHTVQNYGMVCDSGTKLEGCVRQCPRCSLSSLLPCDPIRETLRSKSCPQNAAVSLPRELFFIEVGVLLGPPTVPIGPVGV